MNITKVEINEGEQIEIFHLAKEMADKYNEILKTRNLTSKQFFQGALYLFETFTEKQETK